MQYDKDTENNHEDILQNLCSRRMNFITSVHAVSLKIESGNSPVRRTPPPPFSHEFTVNLVILRIPSSRKTHLQAVASIRFSVNDVKDIFLDFLALARKRAPF